MNQKTTYEYLDITGGCIQFRTGWVLKEFKSLGIFNSEFR